MPGWVVTSRDSNHSLLCWAGRICCADTVMESIVAADGGIVTNGDFNNNNQPARETRLKGVNEISQNTNNIQNSLSLNTVSPPKIGGLRSSLTSGLNRNNPYYDL